MLVGRWDDHAGPIAGLGRLLTVGASGGASLRKVHISLCVLALLSGVAGTLRAQQAKHTPTLTESLSLKAVNGEQISPDGKFIAYRVRETDWKENAYVRQIWVLNVATGESFQLTRGKKSA